MIPAASGSGDHEILVDQLRDALGRATGRMSSVPTFREGKVSRVEQWLNALGQTPSQFDRITVYGDSVNDLPLLEWATHPVATNPSATLAAVATERGWPILHLFEREQ